MASTLQSKSSVFSKTRGGPLRRRHRRDGGKSNRKVGRFAAEDAAKVLTSLMKKVEFKEPIPEFKGTDHPIALSLPHPGFKYEPSPLSTELRQTMVTMLGEGMFRTKLSTALNMSSSGSGTVNSTINASVATSIGQFSTFSTLFNEYFIQGFRAKWQPVSLANGPIGFNNTTQVASLPIGCATLQHSQTAYSSMSAMAIDPRFSYQNTGKSFVFEWINTERHSDDTVATQTTTVTTQGWALTTNTNYSGQMQFQSQAAPPALPTSQVLGAFVVDFDIYFRNRN